MWSLLSQQHYFMELIVNGLYVTLRVKNFSEKKNSQEDSVFSIDTINYKFNLTYLRGLEFGQYLNATFKLLFFVLLFN